MASLAGAARRRAALPVENVFHAIFEYVLECCSCKLCGTGPDERMSSSVFSELCELQILQRNGCNYEPGVRGADDKIIMQHIPRTVREPAGEVWLLSLQEAKRIAVLNNKQIAVVGYQPAEADAAVHQQLSAWDTFFEFGGGWGWSDRQVGSIIQSGLGTSVPASLQNTFGGQNNGTNATSGGQSADFYQGAPGGNTIGFSKNNVVGGRTSISYNLNYQRLQPAGFLTVNPSWNSTLQLEFVQPLLQGAGVEFNRSNLMIARSQHEQSVATFAQNVQTLLRDVEVAYWQVYQAYAEYFSRVTALEQASATWVNQKVRETTGTAAKADVAQAREQLEFFREESTRALGNVLSAERRLRELMGIAPEDGRQIITEDPVVAEYEPDYVLSAQQLMENRPDLIAQRFAIRAAELALFRQQNGLLPDLSISGSYGISGLDNQFDQSLDRLTDNRFTEWTMGIRYRRQIGERSAHAAVQLAKVRLSASRAQLQDLEHRALHSLVESYRGVINNYERIQILLDRREAAVTQLDTVQDRYEHGAQTIEDVLRAQVRLADTTRDLAGAIITYNQQIAEFELARGNMLANDNVVISEETINCTGKKFRCLREKQIACALPLPIHPGCEKPGEPEYCPTSDKPRFLYPYYTLGRGATGGESDKNASGETKPADQTKPDGAAPQEQAVPNGAAPSDAPKPNKLPTTFRGGSLFDWSKVVPGHKERPWVRGIKPTQVEAPAIVNAEPTKLNKLMMIPGQPAKQMPAATGAAPAQPPQVVTAPSPTTAAAAPPAETTQQASRGVFDRFKINYSDRNKGPEVLNQPVVPKPTLRDRIFGTSPKPDLIVPVSPPQSPTGMSIPTAQPAGSGTSNQVPSQSTGSMPTIGVDSLKPTVDASSTTNSQLKQMR